MSLCSEKRWVTLAMRFCISTYSLCWVSTSSSCSREWSALESSQHSNPPNRYMVVMSRSIQGVFYKTDMCRPVAGILSCLILFISNQARTLRNIAFLSIVSFVTIFIVLTICLHDIEDDGVVPDSKHDIVRGVVVCSSSFMEYH